MFSTIIILNLSAKAGDGHEEKSVTRKEAGKYNFTQCKWGCKSICSNVS